MACKFIFNNRAFDSAEDIVKYVEETPILDQISNKSFVDTFDYLANHPLANEFQKRIANSIKDTATKRAANGKTTYGI